MSVRLRLTLWYTILTILTIVTTSAILYAVLHQTISADTDAFLASKAQDLVASIRITPSGSGGTSRYYALLPVDVDRFVEADVYAQELSLDGAVLDESMNMSGYGMPMDPTALAAAQRGQASFRTVTIREIHIRVYTRPLILPGYPPLVLQVGRAIDPIETTLTRLQRALLIGDGMIALIACGLGWWMAGSALRPIARTTKAVQAIGESGCLDRRIDYRGPADEIGELIYTFNRMLDRLESTLTAQRRFIADASHELRTPLTTLRINVELLRRDSTAGPTERAEVLDDVATEIDRLSRLVHGLLDLARADAGFHLEKQSIRADEIIREVYQQARPTANGVAITLGELVPITILGSPDYLKQLLLSLVDNALKYTPAGGEVHLDAESDGRWIKFIVSDTGPGISPEDLPHIFERFYRSHAVRAQRGTGLGLAVAQWIAQEHGGYIEVQSALGHGTTFTVWLPGS